MSSLSKWRNVVFYALAALLAPLAFPLLAADPPKCRLVRIDDWPVQLIRGLPVIEGSINGKKIGVLLDTVADASPITSATAERPVLSTWGRGEYMTGVGGEARVRDTRISEL